MKCLGDMHSHHYSMVLLPIVAVLVLALALSIGPDGFDYGQVPTMVIWELRLPRALCAFAVGGLLALAGVLMQALLGNPLADPYILGLSGGAACATLLALLFDLPAAWLTWTSFAGAMIATLLIFGLARMRDPTRLLLTGVVLAAGWGALISLILALSPAARLPGMLFWLMGDLSDAEAPLSSLVVLTFSTVSAIVLAQPMDLLAQGETQALVFGVATTPLRNAMFLLAALCTATAVTVAGSIGFLGLIVPHLLRLLSISNHQRLIPNAVLLGGTTLLLADTLARTLIAPQELPVGVITALLGVPVFLYLLRRNSAEV